MLDRISLPVLNRLLRDDPWAMQRLSAFAGASIRLLWGQAALNYCIDARGLLVTIQTPAADGESGSANDGVDATLTIELPADASARFIRDGRQGVLHAAKVRGNVELANALSDVADNLRPDPEAFLASKIGDLAAHRAIGLFDTLRLGVADLAKRLKDQFSEHVAEGYSVIVPNADLTNFSHDVNNLRDDVARLQQRVARLR